MSSSAPPSPALDADRRKKSSVPEKSRIVTISVNCQEHETLSFRIKGDAPLKKLVDKYFEKASVARTLVELIYNGERLQVQRTPDQLGMKDMVEIDAMVHANGGGNQL
ncbi:unnamed protein product [Rhodiola kirilowii]